MAGQGRMGEGEVLKVIYLLSSTDMTAGAIAMRMSCSKSTILSINRKFQVRQYNGLRSRRLTAERETEKKSA